MGRGKMEIKRIENPIQRQSTFYKRRDGLFKKAKELAILCDANLLLLLFSTSGKLYEYHSPSFSSTKEFIEKYEEITKTKICGDREEQIEEIQKIEKLCEMMERELRFMKVEESQYYTLPALSALEQTLQDSINRVRSEKDRKMQVEMIRLENMLHYRQQERLCLCEKLANEEVTNRSGIGCSRATFGYGLDLKLGFN